MRQPAHKLALNAKRKNTRVNSVYNTFLAVIKRAAAAESNAPIAAQNTTVSNTPETMIILKEKVHVPANAAAGMPSAGTNSTAR